jgi:hypothetical protein
VVKRAREPEAEEEEEEAQTQPVKKKARKEPQLETFVINGEDGLAVYVFNRSSTKHSTAIMDAFLNAQEQDATQVLVSNQGKAMEFINYIMSVLSHDAEGSDDKIPVARSVPKKIRKLSKKELGSWTRIGDQTIPGSLPPGIHFPVPNW